MKGVKRGIAITLLAIFLLSSVSTVSAFGESSSGWVIIKAPAVAKLPSGQMIGVVTYFEVKVSPGNGHVFVETWPLAQIDLQASARLATMVACKVLGLNWTRYNFYFIVKSNATIIGGPSAGLTMTIATIAALTGWKINPEVMATGMINPDGTVGAVGGILEKAQAVHEAGAKIFLIPLGQGNVTVYEKVTRQIGPFVEISWRPKVINVVKYAKEHWNLTVIQVGDVYQAIWYFFGKNVSRPKYPGVKISTSFLKPFVPQDLNRTLSLLKKAEKEVNSSNKLLKYFYNYLYGISSILDEAKDYYLKAKDYYSSGLYYSALCSDFTSRIYSTYLIEMIGALKSSDVQKYVEKCLSYEYSQLKNASKVLSNLSSSNPVSLQGEIAVEYRYFDAYNSLKQAWNYMRSGEYRNALMRLAYAEQRIWSIYFWAQVSSTLVSNGTVNSSEVKSLAFQEIQFARLVNAYVASMFGSQKASQEYLEDALKAYYSGYYGAALVYATMSRIQNEIFLETLGLPQSAIESRLKDVRQEAYLEICEAYMHAPPILALCYFQQGNVSFTAGEASKAMFYYKLAGEWANVICSLVPSTSHSKVKVIPGKTSIPIPTSLPKVSNETGGNRTVQEIQSVFPLDVSHVVMIGALVVVIFVGCWMLRSRKRRGRTRDKLKRGLIILSSMALVNPRALRLGRRILKEEEKVLFLKPKIVDVYTGEILEGYNVLCSGPYVFQLTKREPEADLRVSLHGFYLVPGFIEGHIHVESSMLIPSEFSKLAVSHGTTLVVADPHEVANVSGLEGVMAFMQNARESPLRFLFEAPSCVPATDPRLGLETPGRILGKDEVSALLSLEYVIGLGEVMDFFSVLSGEARDKLEVALQREKIIEGHMPKMPEEMINLEKFLGISSCHESTEAEEALEKIRRGIHLMIREGSAWRDLKALLPLFTELGIDPRRASFVSDDLSVVDLVEKGHIDRILREAISLGLDPIKAIQMATLSPAEHLGLSDLFGGISPGCMADFAILEDLEEVRVLGTVIGGKIRYYKGKLFNWPKSSSSFPNFMLDSVHVKKIPSLEDLGIEAKGPYAEVRVIEAVPGSALTYERRRILKVEGGIVRASGDVRYVSVLERHHGTGNFSSGFVSGIPIRGALAQSIAHDSHHIIGVGDNLGDLALAIKAVCLLGGGIVYVREGKIISKVPLEVSGLMSSRPWREVYEMAKELAEKFGPGFESIHLTVSLLALPVIPELRITDRGLVRVEEGRRVPVIVEEEVIPERGELSSEESRPRGDEN